MTWLEEQQQQEKKKVKASTWITGSELDWINKNRDDISLSLFIRRLIRKGMISSSATEENNESSVGGKVSSQPHPAVVEAVDATTPTTTEKNTEVEAV